MNHLEDPPQPPLKRGESPGGFAISITGENLLKVPLLKGDLGGSFMPNFRPKTSSDRTQTQ
jgi:hypothetical protein